MKNLIICGRTKDSFSYKIVSELKKHLGEDTPTIILEDDKAITQEMVSEYQKMISEAENIYPVFSIHWGHMPYLMKKFVDLVFKHGFAFEYTTVGKKTLLDGRNIIQFSSTGTPGEYYQEVTEHMNWLFDKTIWEWVGFKVLDHKYFYGVVGLTDEQAKGIIKTGVEQTLSKLGL